MKELEIEIKAYCDDLDKIKRKITELGADFVKTSKETDLYFNHPEKDFGDTDEALRIRTVNSDSILTYKGPKISIKSKARIEKEVIISDETISRDILLLLGFRDSGTVIKNRDYYLINGITICLDKVEILGSFVELEKIGDDIEAVEKELYYLAGILGLHRFERKSYLELKLAL